MSFLYQGQLGPHTYQMIVGPGPDAIDLSEVTEAVFKVKDPGGIPYDWTADISDQSSSSITLTHTLDQDTTEVPVAGDWRVYAAMTTGDGVVRSETALLTVRETFHVP